MSQFIPYPVTLKFSASGIEVVTDGASTPPGTPTPPPVTPPPPPPPAPPPVQPVRRIDGHMKNVTDLYRRGDERGKVLSNFYFEIGLVVPYKSALQDRVKNELLGGSAYEYARWADPRSFNPEYAAAMAYPEFLQLLGLAQAAEKLAP